ncbi:MAG TPA: YidC/Oxa1 family membrane protein insertase [Acidimicrobiales bacterium]|nr:YidC/Oxa1 family membrane protein insertase [Acidimicrobiales bacterium]
MPTFIATGSVFDPLYHALAWLLALFYSVVPNYGIAIALLTLVVMVVVSPLTVKGTRSMLAMQRIQPEMKKLQAKYKDDRQRLNEEMMALYKEHGVNPVSGCLPMFLQMPVFLVLYRTISELTHKAVKADVVAHRATAIGQCIPQHVASNSLIYQHLTAANCQMKSFGIDLAKSVHTVHGASAVAYWILVVLVVAVQYVQTRQLNGRNPAAAANPQAKTMQRIMPVFFGFISISIQAGVNIYFLVSGLFRIAQQELMWRYDPVLRTHTPLPTTIEVPSRDAGAPSSRPGGLARWLGAISNPPPAAGPLNGSASGNGRPARTPPVNGTGPHRRPSNRSKSKRSRRGR